VTSSFDVFAVRLLVWHACWHPDAVNPVIISWISSQTDRLFDMYADIAMLPSQVYQLAINTPCVWKVAALQSSLSINCTASCMWVSPVIASWSLAVMLLLTVPQDSSSQGHHQFLYLINHHVGIG